MNHFKYAIYTAVLPKYRQECISLLRKELKSEVCLFTGAEHLEPSVRTGILQEDYTPVRNIALFNRRLLLQVGHWRSAASADNLIVDLNPRSITAWLLLVSRRASRRHRTLVWGHLYPQTGPNAPTARLRRQMRKLSDGVVAYTYTSADQAAAEEPLTPTWVAANAIYRAESIEASENFMRDSIIYVGRLEAEKKVDLLIQGFARSRLGDRGLRLLLVGEGRDTARLKRIAQEEGVQAHCEFLGPMYSVADLSLLYARAACSVSPGYAGLGLTQSLGFGVPVAIARDEPHSPEIELAEIGGVVWFTSNSPDDLARTLADLCRQNHDQAASWSGHVRDFYSAERMATGLIDALRDSATVSAASESAARQVQVRK